jgi:hypothetical protein
MIHPDRELRDIVSTELGIMVHEIPYGRIPCPFNIILKGWERFAKITACGVFLVVWL